MATVPLLDAADAGTARNEGGKGSVNLFRTLAGITAVTLAGVAGSIYSQAKSPQVVMFEGEHESALKPPVPKGGYDNVLVKPNAGGGLSLLPSGLFSGPTGLFWYSSEGVPRELMEGVKVQDAWVFGAKIGPNNLAQLTNKKDNGNTIKGKLLLWPGKKLQEKLTWAESRLIAEAGSKMGEIQKTLAKAVLRDGSNVKAYIFYEGMVETKPASEVTDKQKKYQKQGAAQLAYLKDQGALGLQKNRPVQIRALPYTLGYVAKHHEKVVHFIRHGQAFHNLLNDMYKKLGKTLDLSEVPELVDAPLTVVGQEEAKKLIPLANSLINVELVVTSPLTRAIQTSRIALASCLESKLAFVKKAALLAHPNATEVIGVKKMNKRRALQDLKADFPMVDWFYMKDEEDSRWSDTTLEAAKDASERGYDLMMFLRKRPEREIVLVSHCQFLFSLVNTVLTFVEPAEVAERLSDEGTKSYLKGKDWFGNAELRSFVLEFSE